MTLINAWGSGQCSNTRRVSNKHWGGRLLEVLRYRYSFASNILCCHTCAYVLIVLVPSQHFRIWRYLQGPQF